jgi:lysyl-tRNA synthetase class 1
MGERREKGDPYFSHWADQAARRTIAAHPDAELFVVEAGITPSGVVHIGNLREVITVDFLARALRDQVVKVRFIYSWDDFDVFRKVPPDMPEQEMLRANLRRSIADVPDPCGEHDSYASHQIDAFERSIEALGIQPEFIRQSRRYRAGAYAEGIRRALEHRDLIREILDRHRTERLPDDRLR